MIPKVDNSVYYEIETPEGTALSFAVAGLWSRAAAWLIDLSIRIVIYIVLAISLSITGLFGQGLLLIAFFVLEWFYPVFYEVLNHGMTPGKKIIGIRVVDMHGLHIDWSSSMSRNLLRFIDMLPLIYGVGFISLLMTRYSQRIGDLVAGTYVIYDEPILTQSGAFSFLTSAQINPEFQPMITALSKQERSAFVSYAEREQLLSDARKQELLELIRPALEHYNIRVNTDNLKQLARVVADTNETI